jgi:hypothetical protein
MLALPASAVANPKGRVFERSAVEMAPAQGKSFSEVVIDNSLGDIAVEGYEGTDLMIVAVKQAGARDVLDRLKVSLVPEVDGAVQVRTRLTAGLETRPVAAGSVRVDLVVRVPRSATVRAKAWNGKVAAKELDNGAELIANEGEIRADKIIGQLSTENALGAHHVSEVFGAVRARALIGDVMLRGVRGPKLWAVVHRGAIKANGIEVREVYLRAFDGDLDIELSPVAGARLKLYTFKGNIKVRTPSKSAIRFQAHSRSGKIEVGDAVPSIKGVEGRVHGQIEGIGAPAYMSLSSRYGDIQFAVLNSPDAP